MDIYRAERVAQDRMAKSGPKRDWDRSFLLVGPNGIKPCTWRDPYFGLFSIDGVDGFLMTKQVPNGFEVLMADADATAAGE